jgi:hypothetical protein
MGKQRNGMVLIRARLRCPNWPGIFWRRHASEDDRTTQVITRLPMAPLAGALTCA